jgi:hypothetical protein
MNGSSTPIGFYIRLANPQPNLSLPTAVIPDWEICRQEIQASDQDGIKLVEQVLATRLTLRKAWAAMLAIATPRKENPA